MDEIEGDLDQRAPHHGLLTAVLGGEKCWGGKVVAGVRVIMSQQLALLTPATGRKGGFGAIGDENIGSQRLSCPVGPCAGGLSSMRKSDTFCVARCGIWCEGLFGVSKSRKTKSYAMGGRRTQGILFIVPQGGGDYLIRGNMRARGGRGIKIHTIIGIKNRLTSGFLLPSYGSGRDLFITGESHGDRLHNRPQLGGNENRPIWTFATTMLDG